MITLREITAYLEGLAPLSLQESYDNSGLQVGDPGMKVSGILVALDVSEELVLEAEKLGLNLVVSHHPVIFGGLKSVTGSSMPERIVKLAIQKEIAIYSGHTNFDAIRGGVNSALANRLGLVDQEILDPVGGALKKLVVFVPHAQLERVRQAMFDAGAGEIGAYDHCSFNLEGTGTFRGGEGSHPFAGESGVFHQEAETRLETIVPAELASAVVRAMSSSHPYEEVAYDLYPLENKDPRRGMGMIGRLEHPMDEEAFLGFLKDRCRASVVRHSKLLGKGVKKVALCGGSGSFLLGKAKAVGADVFVTGDMKYHQFLEADGKIVVMDIGHFEGEQFTRELFYDLLRKKFPKFAVRLSETEKNPIKYF
ncbi:MAG: Nif3-like dinuclear metal center hexameric protein [Bacteroidales bacterium]|nr:Nif3-like dinuclear metal center hexameric protein [Bacteroidales bacterium]